MNHVDEKISETEAINMLSDISKLMAERTGKHLAALGGNIIDNKLVDNVEYWKWLDRNYQPSGIFSNNQNMQNYIAKDIGNKEWFEKQLQGKGYEWDWMQEQRQNLKNVFKAYSAGDVANRPGTDITEYDLLTGNTKEYQLKAYVSKANPDLHNTPKDAIVITNKEKLLAVKQNKYDVQGFQSKEEIVKARNNRLNDVKQGNANPAYNIKNVGLAMAKAGLVGAIICVTSETFATWKQWKSGQITNEEFAKGIAKAAGNGFVTASATTGIMLKVKIALSVAGISGPVAIPIAIVLGYSIDKVVAPCFGRGRYRELLNEAKYYQNIETKYKDFLLTMQVASEQYVEFLYAIHQQDLEYENLEKINNVLDAGLDDLLKKI